MKLFNYKRLLHAAGILVISLALSGCMASYYYKRGQQAYKRQDYHQSFVNTLRAAKMGDIQAQYATGYMYFYGIGTRQSDYLAAVWFKSAADVGDPKAIAALKQIRARAPYPFMFGLDRSQTPSRKMQPKATSKPRTTYTVSPSQLPSPHSTYAH